MPSSVRICAFLTYALRMVWNLIRSTIPRTGCFSRRFLGCRRRLCLSMRLPSMNSFVLLVGLRPSAARPLLRILLHLRPHPHMRNTTSTSCVRSTCSASSSIPPARRSASATAEMAATPTSFSARRRRRSLASAGRLRYVSTGRPRWTTRSVRLNVCSSPPE